MKNPLYFFCCLTPLLFCLATDPGCTTSQQKVAFNSIYSVEQSATAGVNGYFALVVAGKASTNGVPAVAKAFNDLQAAVVLAAAADQAGTNGLAPASLQAELTALLNLVKTVEGK